ncbi:MAG: DUF1553 domain-containing protein [Bryobacterales bacterium]|nr:DUF1553 domain-containing protein [Bryobacterales bacterium]
MRLAALLALGSVGALSQAKPIDFQKDIRPVLSDNCFACHGPDSKSRMAGLRLDLKDAALEARPRGAAIVPGKPDKSLLYLRIVEQKQALRMPPASSHKKLTPDQIALLKQWITDGAPWSEHWSFRAPVKAKPPAVKNAKNAKNAAWPRTPIDRFVLAKLEAAGLAPEPAADKRTLIRRVALDLTGLPPKPAELDAYLNDLSPQAYEKMVDRYLASPHYGEHRGRYWLDAARYGDTHGIHVDNYREIWPYRDWVIQAFNRNLPFDQFSIEQLAGDMLPNPTLDQKIATGFHRCNVTTNEAGIIEDEYEEIYAKDRADTTGAVWLGLTVGCATCHDHKFDPISQRDFYSLGAFFRNTSQRVMDGNIPDTPPVLIVPRKQDRENWAAITAGQSRVRTEMTATRAGAATAFAQWLDTRAKVDAPQPLEAKAQLLQADIAALANSGDAVKPGDSSVAGMPAIHFVKEEGVKIAKPPKLDAAKPFSMSILFFFPQGEQSNGLASQLLTKDKNRGWFLDISGRLVRMRLYGDNERNIEIRSGHLEQLKHGSWNQVTFSYDGSRHQSGMALYVNGVAIPTQGGGNQNVELPGSIDTGLPITLGRNFEGGAIADFRIFNRVLSESEAKMMHEWVAIEGALRKDPAQLTANDRDALLTYFLLKEHAPFRALVDEQNKLNDEAKVIARKGAITHVMHERNDGKPKAWVLYRGAYDQRRDEVPAATPSILPAMPADLPRNRLGFAQWLFRPEHPLTARVTVNRMWQEIFGAGIVKTADDFGSQGEPPSHPELLDWLAVDFRESGWDMKRFYKQILMSAAYRQRSSVTPAKLAKDPDNRLVSRGPRFRMDGEMVRDYALASSGLLVRQLGGASVRPYQPEGIWEAVAMLGSNTRFYKQDSGDGLYRRSLYTFWKRSAPPPAMEIFNAPTREACTMKRERTNTPLQALATMNDVQFVEAAKVLAEQSMQNEPAFDAQLDFMSTRVLARPLTLAERAVAKKAFDNFRAHYQAHEADAEKLLAVGERKHDPSLAQADFAAMTMLANQLLNLDEVLNK